MPPALQHVPLPTGLLVHLAHVTARDNRLEHHSPPRHSEWFIFASDISSQLRVDYRASMEIRPVVPKLWSLHHLHFDVTQPCKDLIECQDLETAVNAIHKEMIQSDGPSTMPLP